MIVSTDKDGIICSRYQVYYALLGSCWFGYAFMYDAFPRLITSDSSSSLFCRLGSWLRSCLCHRLESNFSPLFPAATTLALPSAAAASLRSGPCLCCCLAYASTPAHLFSATSPGSQLLSMPPPRVQLISSLHCSIDSSSFFRCCVGSESPARRTPPPSSRRTLDRARARCSRGGLAP